MHGSQLSVSSKESAQGSGLRMWEFPRIRITSLGVTIIKTTIPYYAEVYIGAPSFWETTM